MQATKEWYEQFYATRPNGMSPWYRDIFEFLSKTPQAEGPFLELGCGKGELLEHLVNVGICDVSSAHGVEQSEEAIRLVRDRLPHVVQGDITTQLNYTSDSIGVVILAEVIEHIPHPGPLLREINRVLKNDGRLILTFPNYVNLPWLFLRVVAEVLRKPHWIVLQPIDKVYFFPSLVKYVMLQGFDVDHVTGSVFLPPVLYKYEPRWVTSLLRRLRLSWLAFHPVIVFRKCVRND